MFKKNKCRCAKEVLQGTWNAKSNRCTLAEPEAYWRNIFEQESVPDERTPDLIGPVRWELIWPVSKPELEATIMNMRSGAPGPDGMVLHQLKQLPKEELRAHLNLWLMVGHCPTRCCIGETVMIPKDLDHVRPPKHRLITMADMIIRCFHKLMGKRMADLLPMSERQKAFRSGDGLAENVYLLRTVIHHHTRNLLPLNVVFLDISKVFDLESHHSILKAAQCMGVPPPFLTYLWDFYEQGQTSIRVGNDLSELINVTRGVKQGDPMSVHLFNAVIDWALAALDPGLGVEIGEGAWINHLAFADDIALVTRTLVGAQRQIDLTPV